MACTHPAWSIAFISFIQLTWTSSGPASCRNGISSLCTVQLVPFVFVHWGSSRKPRHLQWDSRRLFEDSRWVAGLGICGQYDSRCSSTVPYCRPWPVLSEWLRFHCFLICWGWFHGRTTLAHIEILFNALRVRKVLKAWGCSSRWIGHEAHFGREVCAFKSFKGECTFMLHDVTCLQILSIS